MNIFWLSTKKNISLEFRPHIFFYTDAMERVTNAVCMSITPPVTTESAFFMCCDGYKDARGLISRDITIFYSYQKHIFSLIFPILNDNISIISI